MTVAASMKAANTATMTESDASVRWDWQEHRFRSMNTAVEVALYGRNTTKAAAVETLFRQAEQRMSRFLPDSELSCFNRWDGTPLPLSPELFAALETALWAASATDGLYDPTILDDLEAAGYDRSFEYVVERSEFRWSVPAALVDAPQVVRRRTASYTDIQLDRATGAGRKPAGLRLDLGGMGKGWTVDRAAEWLMGEGPFLVNAGGDLYAHGQPGDARGWAVTIQHPLTPERWIARLFLHHAGLATSTTMKRRWRHAGRTQHHLIDPRRGQPADTDAISVTVVAQRTVLAEIFAKVALLLGAAPGIEFLTATDGVEGLIYTTDGQVLTTPGLAPWLDAVEPAGRGAEIK